MQTMEVDEELMIMVEEHVYSKLQLIDRAFMELYERIKSLEDKDSEKDKRLFFLEIDKE